MKEGNWEGYRSGQQICNNANKEREESEILSCLVQQRLKSGKDRKMIILNGILMFIIRERLPECWAVLNILKPLEASKLSALAPNKSKFLVDDVLL